MPSPSPTTTSAVKLKRRPPLTTLATRLIATTRSTYAVFSWAAPPERSRRSRRSPEPPARRCGPGIRQSSQKEKTSELQPALAGCVGEGGDSPVVPPAAAVEDHGIDASGLGPIGK